MKNIRKKQGIFLTVMILFLVIGDLQIPYYLANADALKTIYSSIPSWYPVYALLGDNCWHVANEKMGGLPAWRVFCIQSTGRPYVCRTGKAGARGCDDAGGRGTVGVGYRAQVETF